jgi:hypothetical protein
MTKIKQDKHTPSDTAILKWLYDKLWLVDKEDAKLIIKAYNEIIYEELRKWKKLNLWWMFYLKLKYYNRASRQCFFPVVIHLKSTKDCFNDNLVMNEYLTTSKNKKTKPHPFYIKKEDI